MFIHILLSVIKKIIKQSLFYLLLFSVNVYADTYYCTYDSSHYHEINGILGKQNSSGEIYKLQINEKKTKVRFEPLEYQKSRKQSYFLYDIREYNTFKDKVVSIIAVRSTGTSVQTIIFSNNNDDKKSKVNHTNNTLQLTQVNNYLCTLEEKY